MTALKKLWPESLYGQLLVTMLVGAAVLQGINLYAVCFIQHSYNQELLKVKYDYDSSIYLSLSDMSPYQREAFLQSLSRAQSALSQPSQFRVSALEPTWAAENSALAQAATLALGQALAAGSFTTAPPRIKARALVRPSPDLPGSWRASVVDPFLQMAIQMEDGAWLEIYQPLGAPSRYPVWMQRLFILLESVIFSLVVFWLIRRATRPLHRLGRAADRFGRNPETVAPLSESGSLEVREAAQSFNRMRRRIVDSLSERNRMLEAMGHDLRTPLARIQLRLDQIEPETLRDKFAANIQEVESIIEQGLELARSLHTSEEAVPLDLAAFAQSIVDDLEDQGLDVTLHRCPAPDEEPPLIMARPTCLRRCLENLLINAVKYAGSAGVCVYRQGGRMIIEVNDNGPGIPEEDLEKVFEPYYRLERSRNRDSGGAGLGLSIARNMVLLNNGALDLRNRPEGGLTARVRLSPEVNFG